LGRLAKAMETLPVTVAAMGWTKVTVMAMEMATALTLKRTSSSSRDVF
jgi:hypothetical protein